MDLDLLDLYRRASEWTSAKVAGAVQELDAPTCCDEWDVRTLMNHMLQTQRYFVGCGAGRRRCAALVNPTGPRERRPGDRLRTSARRDLAHL